MPRDKYNQRKSPTDLDQPPEKLAPLLEFDLTKPWPERYFGQRFGPSLIRKAQAAGYYVMAEIDDAPVPVTVNDARWEGEVLEVLTLEGYRIPQRLFTLTSLRGYKL